MRVTGLVLAASLAVAVPASAPAQTAGVNLDFVAAACSGPAFGCGELVRRNAAAIAASGLPAARRDALLGRLAALVAVSLSPGLPADRRAGIGAALEVVAGTSSDPAQAAAIRNAAQGVADGTVHGANPPSPQDFSPA